MPSRAVSAFNAPCAFYAFSAIGAFNAPCAFYAFSALCAFNAPCAFYVFFRAYTVNRSPKFTGMASVSKFRRHITAPINRASGGLYAWTRVAR